MCYVRYVVSPVLVPILGVPKGKGVHKFFCQSQANLIKTRNMSFIQVTGFGRWRNEGGNDGTFGWGHACFDSAPSTFKSLFANLQHFYASRDASEQNGIFV